MSARYRMVKLVLLKTSMGITFTTLVFLLLITQREGANLGQLDQLGPTPDRMQVSIHPNGGAMIRVMIVDDQAMLRDSLRVAIGQEHDMAVVASLSDASEAPAAVERLGPDDRDRKSVV